VRPLIPRRKRLDRAPVEPRQDDDLKVRELVAVREIVRAFLTGNKAEDVYGLALEHVCPLVGASFASVYLVDDASELMRLGAAHNWPAKFTPFLGEMRVRLGFGASMSSPMHRWRTGRRSRPNSASARSSPCPCKQGRASWGR
jgi:hypothetical protein